MDDQQQTVPQPEDPTAPDSQPRTSRPGRGRRVVATIVATGVVAAVGGVGAGYAIGHDVRDGSTETAASGGGRNDVAEEGLPGTGSVPGDGWSWPGTGQDGSTDPFDEGSGGQSGSDSTDKAAGSQLTGLVRIVSTMRYGGGRGVGSGMVLTSDGEVVTNHHVVDGATSIKVTVMSTGTTYSARVVGTDTRDDVAVLDLDATGLSTVTPDTDGVTVGAAVTAVGDANGTSGYFTAATGTVLAKNQTITTRSEGNASGQRLSGLLKISSDVISGDSGGATYDAEGEVVGMTTAASSGTSDIVGYAVPVAKVLRIVDDLDSGVVSGSYTYGYPAFLGVSLDGTGTTVAGVFQDTPATRIGIAAGDAVTAIGSTEVGTSAELRAAIASRSPGDSVAVTWTDSTGSSHTATATLVEGPVE